MFDPEYFIKGNCLQSSVDVCSVRYKMKFHNKKENVGGSSHIEEQEDGTFKLVWVHTDSEPPDSYPKFDICLLYTSPSPRDATLSRMPSSA